MTSICHIRKAFCQIVFELCIIADDDQIAAAQICARKISESARRKPLARSSYKNSDRVVGRPKLYRSATASAKSAGRFQIAPEIARQNEFSRIQFGWRKSLPSVNFLISVENELGNFRRRFVFRLRAWWQNCSFSSRHAKLLPAP